ncbi:MAG: GNAT family protein [Caulobacterales bacterium]
MKLEAKTLENAFVRLEPITEAHRDGLRAAAQDFSIFRYFPNAALYKRDVDAFVDEMLANRSAGTWLPHAVIANGAVVGQTCYINPRARDRGVEIGGTWYTLEAQGGRINPAAKLLLLTHAFASGAERVELKTDSENARSRAAILKLGASFEGVHRHHILRPDGTWRDTAWYSILRDEWPAISAKLKARLAV